MFYLYNYLCFLSSFFIRCIYRNEIQGDHQYMKKIMSYISFILLAAILGFPAPTSANEAIINTDYLNVRSGPGTNYEKIDQVNTGEVYTIVNEEDNWIEIEINDRTGWVTSEYITVSDKDSEKANSDASDTDS